ncbi:hypothetical protein CBR_g45318 [Chara braunii]|uniref:Integrase catalytic domain-containing protein n=1 Tax=Chara braunii TaxID=69332 RepID=A0A388LY56_CHABU|nr:hypothetical protein CBR_g45318 [Chara braunii]|eukprot:GBG87258.1 hypothetical protein CBR_g45318 [Chara braunii]
MSNREVPQPDDRLLRLARRPIAHLALGPEGDKFMFRQFRERRQQQQRARAAEASRAFASETVVSAAMATAVQQSSQASSSGSVGSTVAQTLSQSTSVMASQPLVITPDKFVIVYLNDILIFSRTVGEHVAHLDKVLSLLRQHKFKINGEKCEFGRTRILYLGHEISAEGLKPDDAKVANIRDGPRPQSVTEMRSFLGMTGYYHNFVKNYSIVAAPLTDLTRLDTPWEWTNRLGSRLSMDFMDTLVTSKSGMRHIFVIVDRFSKYARLVAMPETAKTEYMIRLFKENWVRDFGLPKSIVSDRDVRFTSELWKAAAAEQGTQLQMTSGNHPEANGQAEQLNRAVQHLLRHYIKPNQVDWDEKLILIASLYNNAVHNATGVSPNSLLLTFKPRLPLDFLLPENQLTAAPGTLEFAYR